MHFGTQRIKWDVNIATEPPSVAAASSRRILLELPPAINETPPPPTPDLWLDSTRGVCRDAAGLHLAGANGRVRMWRDSGLWGNHCVFSSSARTMYGVSPLDCIQMRLPVVKVLSGPGVFTSNPLTYGSTAGFTIIAVWRTVATTDGGGGHPLGGAQPSSVMGETDWIEWLGVDTARHVTLPQPIPENSVVVGCWERTAGGQVTWRINTLTEQGGYSWTGVVPAFDATKVLTVGSASRGLHLAQLMLWNRVLTTPERQVIAHWLLNVWDVPLPYPAVGSVVASIPDASVPVPGQMVFWLDATTGLYNGTHVVDYASGGTVTKWADRSGNQRDERVNPVGFARPRVLHLRHALPLGGHQRHPDRGCHGNRHLQRSTSPGTGWIGTVLHRRRVPRQGGASVQREREGHFCIRPSGSVQRGHPGATPGKRP